MSGRHLTKEFAELIKAIGESKTKQEEDRIIKKEIVKLKTMFKAKSKKLSKKDKKEFLVRLIYAEMLGHDASYVFFDPHSYSHLFNKIDIHQMHKYTSSLYLVFHIFTISHAHSSHYAHLRNARTTASDTFERWNSRLTVMWRTRELDICVVVCVSVRSMNFVSCL